MPCRQKYRKSRDKRCTWTLISAAPRLRALQLGSYHFISGVDASSSASLAAYINSLTYAIEDSLAWFAKGSAWKVKNGCYWCVFLSIQTMDKG